MYAVIDLEATGGKPSEERIIEVAIFLYDGKDIVDQFISLVNPEVAIPPFVQKLTGIKQRDVQGAPRFHEIANFAVDHIFKVLAALEDVRKNRDVHQRPMG